MTERRRFYLTTAIAYANNRPGLHTLYEVVGADVIARWHRMLGDDTRFLTGTDEYSVNIATTAAARGLAPKAFVDEMVALFRAAEDALGISPDRFIRTTDPDHTDAVHEMIRRAHANGDIYLGRYEGWYCPNEGFRNTTDLVEDASGVRCPNHPDVELQWLTENNWFFRLSAYQERLERYYTDMPDWVQPEYRKNEMLGFIRKGLEDFSVSREGATWGIPFPLLPDGSSARREDGSWDPAAGTVYVWYDALINYITGAGFPHDAAMFEHWWPADLHVIGKDINRLHTIYWPAMLMSAGLPLPRLVWVHGWLLAQGERMSKSRGNFLDPLDVVAALGRDGTRYAVLREVAFDRDSDVSWDSFVRRYNADLANDFGTLLNRSLSMATRYREGQRSAPTHGALAATWATTFERYAEKLDSCLLHEALELLWSFVGEANRHVEAEQPWTLAKAAKGGDEAAAARLDDVLGDLLEACRVIAFAAAPFMPEAAARAAAQLGVDYGYGAD
ncbi:MAG TPA: methionine--tRNA ligase, partial [Anaerolineae bacterium]|nr:methionine--tRNA ligase [Anaerolineae bacterium]